MSGSEQRDVRGVSVPRFLYGTAWKEDRTTALVTQALEVGFRGIDTANQRRHYHEAGVGEAISLAITSGLVTREDLFLQTKFTPMAGQDHRLPYDPKASLTEQVEQSARSSLEHLGVETLDSYVLHGPIGRHGLVDEDVEIWRAIEALHESGVTRLVGVSNVSPVHLAQLVEITRVPVAFVQNRCFARLAWDLPVRRLCQEAGIAYQGFSLLTANPEVLAHPEVASIAQRLDATVAQVVFAFSAAVGMIPLTGTSDRTHARQDLAALDLSLEPDEVERIEELVAPA